MSKDGDRLREKINDYNKTLGLHDLRETLNKPLGKQFVDNLKLDWIFNRPIEKIIIAGCFLFTVYSIVRLIINVVK